MMASSNKSKWFKCFKSNVGSFHFKEVGGQKEDDLLLHQMDEKSTVSSAAAEDGRRPKKKKFRRGFSRALKSALFQTSSTKKKRSKECDEDGISRSSSSDLSSKIRRAFTFKKTKSDSSTSGESDGSIGHSSRSSILSSSTLAAGLSSSHSSSSSFSFSIANSRSGSERKLPGLTEMDIIKPTRNKNKSSASMKKNGGKCNITNLGLYLLLICLVGIVFWGKAFAIFATSVCFFMVPSRVKEVNYVDFVDFDSEEDHKKKVSLGGLRQQRSCSRILSF